MNARTPSAAAQALIRKLESITDLSSAEREALVDLPIRIEDVRADQDVVREGDRPSQCCLVVEGFTARYKFTDEGKRQIFAFHTPGDIPDILSLNLGVMDHTLGTLTPCRLGFIQHEHLRTLFSRQPRLVDIFWRDTLIDAAIFREWMLGMGRRSAKTSVAHVLCEMVMRLKAVGLEKDNTVPLPLTQMEIGDALGLSTVHVNRTLQELRGDGLIEWQRGVLKVLNWDSLAAEGEFDATYLHQDPQK